MVTFIDAFKNAWNTPSVDMSEVLREEENVEKLRIALQDGRQDYIDDLDDALREYGYQVVYKNGMPTAKRTGNIVQTDEQSKYKILNIGGTLLLELMNDTNIKASKKSINLISDESDSIDYGIRYSSIDAKEYRQDGSDIAYISIVKKSKTEPDVNIFPNYDENKAPAPGITRKRFKQFILMQMSIAHQERMQIVETNKEYQALFFDKKPEVLQISGMLKNTIDNPWSVNMIFLWDELMRGTVLAQNGYICQLYADGELFEGYPFNFQRSKVAGTDNLVNFNFSFLIKNRVMVYNKSTATKDQINVND
jgi:hypothetical protein